MNSKSLRLGGGVLSCLALACSRPDPAAPDAEVAPALGSGVGQAVTAGAAAPAAPRALPEFCAGAASDGVIPAKAALIKDGFVFVEGPVWSERQQAFFFSEMDFGNEKDNGPPAKIHKLTLPASVEVFITDGGSNGLAIDDKGLVACTHDTQTLSRYDLSSKERSVLVSDHQGKHFNSPNDVALHSKGHVYFTDPDWQLGKRTNETGVTGVYHQSPDGKVNLIDGELEKPNGITLSPDETRLYVGAANGVVSMYTVLEDGSVGPRQKFAEVKEPDGMAVDCAGRLYVTSHGPGEVHVLSPDGALLAKIAVAPRATNAAFGGPDRKTLLITAGSGVYSLTSAVAGFPY